MNILLDTHALIWYVENSVHMPKGIVNLIEDPENNKFVCAISLWEIAIKTNLNKLGMSLSLDELIDEISGYDLTVLPIEGEHLKGIAKLPFIHKDPFDRLIVATAIAEELTIITADENMQKYDVSWLW
ncbi:MAG: type II toxin-antitoxin system VapC family toxin [Oscillospiraceae bacterium]|nr:type II toxin-antitoxin system VapC family toxin [Oscillospiraceae bacterium]